MKFAVHRAPTGRSAVITTYWNRLLSLVPLGKSRSCPANHPRFREKTFKSSSIPDRMTAVIPRESANAAWLKQEPAQHENFLLAAKSDEGTEEQEKK